MRRLKQSGILIIVIVKAYTHVVPIVLLDLFIGPYDQVTKNCTHGSRPSMLIFVTRTQQVQTSPIIHGGAML